MEVPLLSTCPINQLPVKSCLRTSNATFLRCHLWVLSPALLLCTSQYSLALGPLPLLQPAHLLSCLLAKQILHHLSGLPLNILLFLHLLLVLEHRKMDTDVPIQWRRRTPCPNPPAVPNHCEAFLAARAHSCLTHNSPEPHVLFYGPLTTEL